MEERAAAWWKRRGSQELQGGNCGDPEAFTHQPPRRAFSGRRTAWLTCWLWLNSRQEVLEGRAVQAQRACAQQPWIPGRPRHFSPIVFPPRKWRL